MSSLVIYFYLFEYFEVAGLSSLLVPPDARTQPRSRFSSPPWLESGEDSGLRDEGVLLGEAVHVDPPSTTLAIPN